MGLDTKHRPLRFADVLGQERITKLLRRYIATHTGLRQSYLLAGPWGSGKTTLGRILARGLLCSNPSPDGDACDTCESCRDFLSGKSLDFIEIDAATNSGKEYMVALTDELQYSTFSGRQRIYLFDEAHQLTANALDAMLKPLEETVPGGNKRLVCIFCTTEPARMKDTILSRCAPAFMIDPVPPPVVAQRLAWVCDQEGITCDPEVLPLIAEVTEGHIRDALKAIEGISLLGKIDRANVAAYLKLDQASLYLDLLGLIGQDLGAAVKLVEGLASQASPSMIYTQMMDLCMWAYRVGLGLKAPIYLEPVRLKALYEQYREGLLGFIIRLGSRPGRPTQAMLLCDLAAMHYGGQMAGEGIQITVVQQQPVRSSVTPILVTGAEKSVTPLAESSPVSGQTVSLSGNIPSGVGTGQIPLDPQDLPSRTVDGICRNARCTRNVDGLAAKAVSSGGTLLPNEFGRLLGLWLQDLEIGADTLGPQRHPNMGRH